MLAFKPTCSAQLLRCVGSVEFSWRVIFASAFVKFTFRRYQPYDVDLLDSVCLDVISQPISYSVISIRQPLNDDPIDVARQNITAVIEKLNCSHPAYPAYSKFMYTLRTLNLLMYEALFDDIDIESESDGREGPRQHP